MLFNFSLPAIFHSLSFPELHRALESLFSSTELLFPAVAMAPSTPHLAKFIPPAHQRKILEPQTGAELKSAINEGNPREAGPAPAPERRTAASQPGLPEGVGKGYVNAEVTL